MRWQERKWQLDKVYSQMQNTFKALRSKNTFLYILKIFHIYMQ